VKKRNIVLLALLLLGSIVTTTQAWSIIPITQESSFYEAETEASDRTISNFRSRPLGKNKILIIFDVSAGTEYVNVTVQPLDEYGNILNSTGPGSKIKYSAGGDSLVEWRDFLIPDTEMIFYYEHEDTTGGQLKVLFIISDIVFNYETVLIEIEDYT
jgi:hypothetical protein